MSDDITYTIAVYIKNTTCEPLTYNNYELGSDTAMLVAPSTIPAGAQRKAFQMLTTGDKKPLVGTVNYTSKSNTAIIIQLSGGAGISSLSAAIGCTGQLCNNSIFVQQTDYSYTKLYQSFSNTQYFLISSQSLSTAPNSVTSKQLEVLTALPLLRSIQKVDKITVISKSCKNYNEKRVAKLYQGHEYATARDILDVAGVPTIDKVDIIFKVDFLSPKESLLFGVAFSELILNILDEQPELAEHASEYLTALKATLLDNISSELGTSYTKLADKSDDVFEELTKPQQHTIEILKNLVDIKAQHVPLYIKSCIDVLAEGYDKKKKVLENFMFNYLNDIDW